MTPDSLPRLARAEAAAHARYGESGAVAHFGPLVAVHAGPDLAVNAAWHGGTPGPTEADLDGFEAFSAEHGQPAKLHVLSHTAPAVVPLLRARGYALASVLHAYTHGLTDLPPLPALTVREEPDADLWADLSARGFGPGTGAIMRLVAHAPGAVRLVAEVDGEPAGTAALSVTQGVAAFYGTSTRPEFRGRGVQTALLAARLHLAAEAGADLASVFVTPGSGSERNVRRAGFRVAGVRLTFTRAG
ncbi:GNAT superfamily N-acetyltransferase [Deinococcus sp. HSC-46F16]|uniref:GNAT family N-acetyltransferase n=1 Tax=Deinococcus sp. HSC-46F16 TaxID=2910968 RepID=UPI00209E24A5|nr:GNAT family N-acetyltransferase [Deinococcus sp. HSC-46F16]MCP2015412.1 GNAT superfamily N-acetyltransferase [Deinococcus sp. HSC-46F16]